MTGKKTTKSKSPPKKSMQKNSITTGEKIDKELQKIPEKMQDILVNGIIRDLLIIIFIPILYNLFRVGWAEIVTLPELPELFLNKIGNIIVLSINLYENYIDLHKMRNIFTALVDLLVNIIIGIAFSDPTFIVMGVGYIVIVAVRFWFNYQAKRKGSILSK